MNRSLRHSAQWFNRGLWLVALVFASFLTGLSGVLVDDLPHVEQHLRREDFVDQAAAGPLRAAVRGARVAKEDADRALDQATPRLQAAQQAYANGHDVFVNWLQTRKVTGLPGRTPS